MKKLIQNNKMKIKLVKEHLNEDLDEKEIDKILDKILDKGIDSLTFNEKNILSNTNISKVSNNPKGKEILGRYKNALEFDKDLLKGEHSDIRNEITLGEILDYFTDIDEKKEIKEYLKDPTHYIVMNRDEGGYGVIEKFNSAKNVIFKFTYDINFNKLKTPIFKEGRFLTVNKNVYRRLLRKYNNTLKKAQKIKNMLDNLSHT